MGARCKLSAVLTLKRLLPRGLSPVSQNNMFRFDPVTVLTSLTTTPHKTATSTEGLVLSPITQLQKPVHSDTGRQVINKVCFSLPHSVVNLPIVHILNIKRELLRCQSEIKISEISVPTWQRVGATPESVPTYELNPAHFLPNACSSDTRVLVCQHEGCGFDSRPGLWSVTPSLTNLGSSAVNC